MADLKEIIEEKLSTLCKEGFLDETVDKHLKSCIDNAVANTFRSYSDFSCDLKKHIQQNLSVNLTNLNLNGYNKIVKDIIQSYLDKEVMKEHTESLKKDLDKIFTKGEKEITLSNLLETMVESESEEAQEERWEYPSIHLYTFEHSNKDINLDNLFEKTDTIEDYSGIIYFDPQPDIERYRCKYQLVLHDGFIHSLSINDSLYKKKDTGLLLGGYYNFDRKLIMYYTNGAKVILDKNYDSVCYPEQY